MFTYNIRKLLEGITMVYHVNSQILGIFGVHDKMVAIVSNENDESCKGSAFVCVVEGMILPD